MPDESGSRPAATEVVARYHDTYTPLRYTYTHTGA